MIFYKKNLQASLKLIKDINREWKASSKKQKKKKQSEGQAKARAFLDHLGNLKESDPEDFRNNPERIKEVEEVLKQIERFFPRLRNEVNSFRQKI